MEWKHYKMDELIEEISMGPFGSDVKKNSMLIMVFQSSMVQICKALSFKKIALAI